VVYQSSAFFKDFDRMKASLAIKDAGFAENSGHNTPCLKTNF